MPQTRQTVFYQWHCENGATMVPFGGWEMPIQYPAGIIAEHLRTRKTAGIFDVSHMGRFKIRGKNALAFVQHVLSNNAADLEVGQSQYTMIPDENGGAIDDAYLYRFLEDEFLLVVNAANSKKDWQHLNTHRSDFTQVDLIDVTEALAMISLQGPEAEQIIKGLLTAGELPGPVRNWLSIAQTDVGEVHIARTGYTGEPICFELFLNVNAAPDLWQIIIDNGASPVGLGARDTLRLEAALPLYGHELGQDLTGKQIPIFACPLARFAVNFSSLKGNFIGKPALWAQFNARKQIISRNYQNLADLPCRIFPIRLNDKGIARTGAAIFKDSNRIGYVTSGTMVPYWEFSNDDDVNQPTDKSAKRAIGLALIDSRCNFGDDIWVEVRGKRLGASIVPSHLNTKAPPYARALVPASCGK